MDLATMVNSLGDDYITRINNAINAATDSGKTTGTAAVKESGTFDSIYQSAVGLINSTNSYIQSAQQAEIDFALGKITSTHELGVIQQKANLALSYTVAIRDKVLDAYKEIMQMQI
ncbi:MAG: flagellar hook-basal body complex protein FliE [Lachnospiraceae bacterium]